MPTIYKSLILTSTKEKTLKSYKNGYMVVSDSGEIVKISQDNPQADYPKFHYRDLSSCAILPGFVDVHNHLPQYAFAGVGGMSLIPWLKRYTFPREEMFEDEQVAQSASEIFFRDALRYGTTTTMTYTTIHKSATDIAFQVASKSGIRAFIGKVMMNQNSPRSLTERAEQSIEEALALADKWNGHDERLFYVLTPRFAMSCSFELMRDIGKIAKEKNLYIQSHLSENREEIALTQKLFPKSKSYTDVYLQAGLLGEKSIMAHGVHLGSEELNILKKTKTKLAHCPTSNRFLGSGIMPLKRYDNLGLSMGLGSDVAGGYSLSILNEMRESIESSKTLSYFLQESNHESVITPSEAFYFATLGGATVLGMERKIGSLEVGKKADFIVVDYQSLNETTEEYNQAEQILSQLIYRGDRETIKEVYVGGNRLV